MLCNKRKKKYQARNRHTMARQLSYLIIGNGIAGVTAAEILRDEDVTCSLTIIADDPFPVYYRPALKDYLAGRVSEGKLWARPSTFYRQQRIRFVPGRVVGINTLQHFVQLQNGKQISYDKLLLANGARPRQLACPGLGLAGVTTLRSVADYREVLRRLSSTSRIVVCGSGTLALESAETLQQHGYEVTHLLRYHTLWSEVLDATASDLVLQEERRAGVDIRKGEEIREIVGRNGQVSEVITSSGAHIPCDLVLIAIGIEPVIDFIQACGIACGRGVKVDAAMHTNAADIYAAGDVIETTDSLTGQTRVLGQWYPALQQARAAAYSMLDLLDINHGSRHGEVIGYMNYYNATFLYGLDFVSIGLTTQPPNPQNAQQLVEVVAAPQPRSYRKALFLNTGVPVGALFLGERKHALAFKRAIDHRINLAPIANYLFADDFNLEEHIHFEIDMCIGCDRCMHACPVPLSSLVTIADLNHATVSTDVASHVARFTHECIMCGSCVPVCPVDNHRDLLMLTLKHRLGISWDDEVDMKRVAQALPMGWTIPLLISRLREHPLLSNPQLVPDRYLLHLFIASKLLSLATGATVIHEGDYGRDLYLILGGHVSLFATEADGKEFPIAILGQGEYVGQYGMLTGQPYTTTARAQTPCALLQVPEQVIQRLMELLPNVRQFFEQLNNTRSLISILKRMPLFQGISNADIDALVRQTQVRHYDRDERLFAEDDTGGRPARETLHILLEGFVKVARHTTAGTGYHKSDERIIAYRQAGDYFVGGLDLLGDGRAVTVTTINRTRVAEVPRLFMQALLQRYPEVNQRFRLRLREYLESTTSVQPNLSAGSPFTGVSSEHASPNPAVTAGLHALVSDGVVEGTEVLVIDLDTCIHCNECEQACARRHGHSRMNRKGMVVGNISIATACRQCQDPVCMLCSRAGIARLPNGEVYITESCIGCGICAERCPYGAISIVDVGGVGVETEEYSSWQRFSSFFTNGAGKGRERIHIPMFAGNNYVAPGPLDTSRPRNAYAEMRKKVAIKCDLCAGYKDQACVEACPTGAAIRVQPTTFFGSTEEILRRRVF